jgi:hypothetical protein
VSAQSARYNWRAASNAGHLRVAFDAYVAEHGRICQGVAACGIRELQGCRDAPPHPAAKLVPIAVYPVSVGGEPDGAVLVLCPFCVERWLAIIAGGLEVLEEARHGGRRVAAVPTDTPGLLFSEPQDEGRQAAGGQAPPLPARRPARRRRARNVVTPTRKEPHAHHCYPWQPL